MAEPQRPLFNDDASAPAWVPRVAQDTSHEAADAVAPKAKILRERVFEALGLKPATDQQLAIRLNIGLNTIRPRRGELVKTGRVRDSGVRATLESGRKAIVWEVIP